MRPLATKQDRDRQRRRGLEPPDDAADRDDLDDDPELGRAELDDRPPEDPEGARTEGVDDRPDGALRSE